MNHTFFFWINFRRCPNGLIFYSWILSRIMNYFSLNRQVLYFNILYLSLDKLSSILFNNLLLIISNMLYLIIIYNNSLNWPYTFSFNLFHNNLFYLFRYFLDMLSRLIFDYNSVIRYILYSSLRLYLFYILWDIVIRFYVRWSFN